MRKCVKPMDDDFFLINGPLGGNDPDEDDENNSHPEGGHARGNGPVGCGLVMLLVIFLPIVCFCLI
ncbi:MAG: hypothetical protein JXR89_03210 [Deltaproteobacteria bacterium]|nr:hypothetical protein [Deltaproteobacteria bacterium]